MTLRSASLISALALTSGALPLGAASFAEAPTHRDDRCSIDAFFGITHETIDARRAASLGLQDVGGTLVTNVVACSGAAEAGLEPLDYLYAVDGEEVERSENVFCLLGRRRARPGDTVEVGYVRKGDRGVARVVLTTRGARCDAEEPFPSRGFFGISGARPDDQPGAILEVSSDGPAAKLGLRDGDRLLRVDGYAIGGWSDLSTVKRTLGDIDAVTFEVVRDGEDLTLSGPLEKGEDSSWSYGNWGWTDGWDRGDRDRDCDDCPKGRSTSQEVREEVRSALAEAREEVRQAMAEVREELRDTEEERRAAGEVLEEVNRTLSETMADLFGGDGARGDDGDGRDGENSPVAVALEDADNGDWDRLRDRDVPLPRGGELAVDDLVTSPNPSDGRFRLSFTLPERGETSVAVYSATGREVYAYTLGEYTGAFDDELDIMRNGAGTYYLVVRQGERAAVRKLVLSRR